MTRDQKGSTTMRPLSLVLLLSLPGIALGQAVQRGPHSSFRPAHGAISAGESLLLLSIPFGTTGCYPSGSAMGTRGETVTSVRASIAENTVGGSPVSCAANQMRVTDATSVAGLLVEPLRNQYLSTSDNPTTATATVPTGANSTVAWLLGSGSADLSQTGGTATTSGLPCTVTSSTPCVFSVTGTGSAIVSWTSTGTVTFGQVEWGGQNPGFKSSKIHTVSTRNADVVSLANPLPAGAGCLCADAELPNSRSWTAYSGNLWTTGTVTSANTSRFFMGGNGYFYFDTYDASATLKRLALGPVTHWADGSRREICACMDLGCTLSLWVDGFKQLSPLAATTGTGACTTFGSPVYLGGQSNGQSMLGGVISSVRAVRTANGAKASRGEHLQPYQVAALGDSITQYGSPPYVTTLATLLGSQWKAGNFGAAGERTSQILPRWSSSVRPSAAGSVVILGGINDINNGEAGPNGTTTIANLETMYDSALATGMRLVPVTILPAGGQASWNAGKETLRGQINTWILSYCTAHSITCINADPTFNDGSNNLTAIYDSGDHLHPNQDGYDALAALIRAAFP